MTRWKWAEFSDKQRMTWCNISILANTELWTAMMNEIESLAELVKGERRGHLTYTLDQERIGKGGGPGRGTLGEGLAQ